MPDLLVALNAFLQEHRHCGELAAALEGQRVWMACDCAGGVAHPVRPPELDRAGEQQ